jgi:glycosyltransferase involved in cell wall biosynthesis
VTGEQPGAGPGDGAIRLALSLLSFRAGRIGGAETYVRNLVEELPRVAGPGDRLVLVLDPELAAALETTGWERRVVPWNAPQVVRARILEALTPWRARAIERVFGEIGADVQLFPQQSIFPKRVEGRVLLTAVDVQHLYHPENIPLAERVYRRAAYPGAMRRADHVLAISEFTRSTLIERCRVPADRVTAVPLGYTARVSRETPTDRVAGPYLYYPAATFPHKNHAVLLRSYAVLRRRGAVREKLVFTGMQTPAWPGLARLAAALGVADDVVHLGFLPYAEVRRVFAGAEAVLFPSRYEGFGIPVVEAATEFRKKVITSRLPVLDEVGVPRERQIDFEDPEALLAALRLEGPTVLERTPATWRECARRTLEVARELVRASPR